MSDSARRPTPPSIKKNPLQRLVKDQLHTFRQQALTTIRNAKDVAALMEIQASTLNTYLIGRRRATPEFCDRLAAVLGMETSAVEQAAADTWLMRPATDVRHKKRVAESPMNCLLRNRLRDRRVQRMAGAHTLSELADVLGVTLATLNSYMDGRRRITPTCPVSPAKIADAIELTVEQVEQAAMETWTLAQGQTQAVP